MTISAAVEWLEQRFDETMEEARQSFLHSGLDVSRARPVHRDEMVRQMFSFKDDDDFCWGERTGKCRCAGGGLYAPEIPYITEDILDTWVDIGDFWPTGGLAISEKVMQAFDNKMQAPCVIVPDREVANGEVQAKVSRTPEVFHREPRAVSYEEAS